MPSKIDQQTKTNEREDLNESHTFRQTHMVKYRNSRILDKVITRDGTEEDESIKVVIVRKIKINLSNSSDGIYRQSHVNTSVDIKVEQMLEKCHYTKIDKVF